MTAHREKLKEHLSKIYLDGVAVVDWGAGTKPAARYINHNNCTFFRVDKNADTEQELVGDIQSVDLPFTNYDVAFCLEVLEHVEYPFKVLRNIYRHLKRDGILYLSVPFRFEVHATEDYWRFTKNGIKLLLEQNHFKVHMIQPLDGESGYFVSAYR